MGVMTLDEIVESYENEIKRYKSELAEAQRLIENKKNKIKSLTDRFIRYENKMKEIAFTNSKAAGFLASECRRNENGD